MTRIAVFAAATAVSIALLWVIPPVGLIAIALVLIIVPPWGKTYSERAIISGIVILGTAAIIFPRAGSTPIDAFTARSFLSVLAVVAVGLYLIPRLRLTSLPKPRLTDGLVLVIAVGFAYWLMSSYLGTSSEQMLNGLFFSGWDNQAHFTTFANTYSAGSTTWPTVDGSIAWNQWYPSLHTTVWALAEYAAGSTGLSRIELLFPFIRWNGFTFAVAMTALAWVASDLAHRWLKDRASSRSARTAGVLAAAATASWIVFGSPQFLYNAGFTNFVLGVAVVTTASYLSVRSTRSARSLGWFLVPLAAIAVIGLWTPLVVALVPAGVVVAVILVRTQPIVGVAWVLANVIVGGLLAWQQGSAILGADEGLDAAGFAEAIGGVNTGMAPFNIAAGIAAPFLAIAIAVALRGQRPLAFAIAGPSVLTGLLAVAFIPGTDASGISRIQSYYVLKALDASLIATAPLLAAAAAGAFVLVLKQLSSLTAGAATVAAGLLALVAFGYVGITPQNLSPGFTVAPGVQAGIDRARGVQDPLVGHSILATVTSVQQMGEYSPVMWDAAGTLQNLWAATLHETMSASEQSFYLSIPPAPYGDDAYEYIRAALAQNPNLRVAITWFRPTSGEFLTLRFGTADPRQVQVVEVPMRSSALCPECPE